MNSESSVTGKNSPPTSPIAGSASAPTNERDREDDHRQPVIERPADDALVAVGLAVEPVVEPVELRAMSHDALLRRHVRIRPVRRQHRVERERDEQRHQHRAGDRQRERREPLLGDAAHERDRHEHGDDRERRRRDGEADLVGALVRRACSGPSPSRCGARCSRAPRSRRRSGCRSRARARAATSC